MMRLITFHKLKFSLWYDLLENNKANFFELFKP